MPLTFGSVATLAARFDRPVARIDPNDTKATLDRVGARKANPSAVANAPRGASIRQAMAGPQPVRRPEPHPVSSEPGRGTSPATSRSTTETPGLRYQAKVATHRAFFEQLASKPNMVQTSARLDRAAIPKRLGTGMHPGTVVWEPIARDHVPHVERVPSRNEVIDRPQTMGPDKSTRNPGQVVNHLADIVQNRKAELRVRQTSLVHANEDIITPAKFSMSRPVSPRSPPASGGDSGRGSPTDYIVREPTLPNDKVDVGMPALPPPSARLAALQSRFSTLYADPSMRALSPASSEESLDSDHSCGVPDTETHASVNEKITLEHYYNNLALPASSKVGMWVHDEPSEIAHSDYGSNSSGSSSPSSPPGSPVARELVSPWSQAYAEALDRPPFTPPDDEVTWTKVYDAIGQLNAAIDDENMYEVSSDAIDLLQLAESYIAARNISSAYDALMRAREGVTAIQAAQGGTAPRSPSPASSEPLLDSWEEEPTDEEWVEKLDDCFKGLKKMAADYGKSARGRAASDLRAAASEMLERSPVRSVVMFLEPAMRDLIHLPTMARPVNRPEVSEGFWT